MTVLVTLDFPPETGGIQRYLHDIAIHTFSVDDMVVTGNRNARSEAGDTRYPCRIVRLGFPGERINKKVLLLPIFWKLLHSVAVKRQDLFLAGNIYAALALWVLSLFFPVKYHVFCYGTELLPLKKKSLRNRLWKAVLHRAGKVYYLTVATRSLLTGWYGCEHCTQRVPKIDLPVFSLDQKFYEQDDVRILSVGRLVPHKGHALLVEAAARLADLPGWHLTIAGSGPEEKRLNSLIQQRSLEQRITVQSDVTNEKLQQLYKQAEVFVFPSIATLSAIEGFGIVLLEAMAYGAAIIAARSGGIAEVVEDNSDYAMLVPPGEVDMLADAMRQLIVNGDKRQRMALAARVFLERSYVW